jgi:NADPH:quinone reductase-like Zn-dependent oxidoreductase
MEQAWQIKDGFGLDHLQLAAVAPQEPGPGQVRVQVLGQALNYRDWLMVTGRYNPKQPLPLVPLSDGAGVIDAVGDGVSQWQVGDRVLTCFAQDWLDGQPTRESLRSTLGGPRPGTLQTHMVLPEHGVVRAPAGWSHAEAATLTCAGLTAFSALVVQGGLQAGQHVVVQGSGGVSVFALQIAKALGAKVLATTSSHAKAEQLRALGAEVVVNYREQPDWGKAAFQWAQGGVDHVVEVGGAETLQQSLQAVRPGATVSVIGMLSGSSSQLNLLPLLMQNVRLQGVLVGHRAGLLALVELVDRCGLRPVVDQSFDFAQAPEAFDRLHSGQHIGKVVLER